MENCALSISVAVFEKESLRSEIWWLSIFYGLCIQSIVRKVLIILVSQQLKESDRASPIAHDHFRLATRLFIAISGRYDFLHGDQSMVRLSEYDISRIEETKAAAQFAVKQRTWPKLGFSWSEDFLRHIFEDKEPGLTDVRYIQTTIRPEPYIPKRFDVDTYRRFRHDWDLARRNYTMHVVSIGSKFGWSSETYLGTTKRWDVTEARWRKYHRIALANTTKNSKVCLKSNEKRGMESLLESPEQSLYPLPIYASLSYTSELAEVEPSDDGIQAEKQSPRFPGDLYWPPWIRGPEDSVQEGWCGTCARWLALDGAFQDDKDFNHGVNAATGGPFDKPKEMRRLKEDPAIWWGLCGTCGEWVELLGSKNGETAWFVHSFGVRVEIISDAKLVCFY